MDRIDEDLLSKLGFAAEEHEDAGEVVQLLRARLGREPTPDVRALFTRGADDLNHPALGWIHLLEASEMREAIHDRFDDPTLADACAFGVDVAGAALFVNSQPDAVWRLERGCGALAEAERVADSVWGFLTGVASKPGALLRSNTSEEELRTPSGQRLPAELLEAVISRQGSVVYEAVLAAPLAVNGLHFGPGEIAFDARGRVSYGTLAERQVVDGMILAPGSVAQWDDDGVLFAFTAVHEVLRGGYRCAAHEPVVDLLPSALSFTPVEDVEVRGFLCAAGQAITDHGEFSLRFTSAGGVYAGVALPLGAGVIATPLGLKLSVAQSAVIGGLQATPTDLVSIDRQGNIEVREPLRPPSWAARRLPQLGF